MIHGESVTYSIVPIIASSCIVRSRLTGSKGLTHTSPIGEILPLGCLSMDTSCSSDAGTVLALHRLSSKTTTYLHRYELISKISSVSVSFTNQRTSVPFSFLSMTNAHNWLGVSQHLMRPAVSSSTYTPIRSLNMAISMLSKTC